MNPRQCGSPTIMALCSVFSFILVIANIRLLLSCTSSELNCIVTGAKLVILFRTAPYRINGLSKGNNAYARPITANAPSIKQATIAERLDLSLLTRYNKPYPAKTERRIPVKIIHLSAASKLFSGNTSHENEPTIETSSGIFSRPFCMCKKPIVAGADD